MSLFLLLLFIFIKYTFLNIKSHPCPLPIGHNMVSDIHPEDPKNYIPINFDVSIIIIIILNL
jgi:hypothetical protein